MQGMIGATVNASVVILGGLIGCLIGKFVSEKISDAIMKGLGLAVILIGVSGALEGKRILVTIVSLALGALIGEAVDIDLGTQKLSAFVERKVKRKEGGRGIGEGMCAGALLFCVGAMAVVGSLDAGLTGDCSTIFAKSLIDFIAAIVMASALGVGISFAALPLFIYQGLITLCASFVAPFLSEAVIAEMNCAGSLIIFGLGLNMIGATKIKVANYLPAIFLPIGLCPLYDLIEKLIAG